MILKSKGSAILIPTESVIPEAKGSKVFLVKNGKSVPQKVELGARGERTVEILSGLSIGDTLITNGIIQVKPDGDVEIKEVSNENRGAAFKCVVALVLPSGQEATREGEIRGEIRRRPTGNGGFGYDPIFRPDGLQLSSAQMSANEKDAISHRGKSLRAIAPHVITLLKTLG